MDIRIRRKYLRGEDGLYVEDAAVDSGENDEDKTKGGSNRLFARCQHAGCCFPRKLLAQKCICTLVIYSTINLDLYHPSLRIYLCLHPSQQASRTATLVRKTYEGKIRPYANP